MALDDNQTQLPVLATIVLVAFLAGMAPAYFASSGVQTQTLSVAGNEPIPVKSPTYTTTQNYEDSVVVSVYDFQDNSSVKTDNLTVGESQDLTLNNQSISIEIVNQIDSDTYLIAYTYNPTDSYGPIATAFDNAIMILVILGFVLLLLVAFFYDNGGGK